MSLENWDVIKRGTLIYGCIAIGLCIVLPIILLNHVKNTQKRDLISLILLLVPMGVFCLWLFWICMYISQMNPMVYPIRHVYEAEKVMEAA